MGSGIAAVVPSVTDSLNNGGAHGFSEMLYAYSSCRRQQRFRALRASTQTPYF
ncbi:MAG: potassium-transporting ATPase subunit KdpA [Oscillospiraceae bacterium]